jgi:hypothetical protein
MWSNFQFLPLWESSWPYLKTSELAKKACPGQTLGTFLNYSRKKFYGLVPGYFDQQFEFRILLH